MTSALDRAVVCFRNKDYQQAVEILEKADVSATNLTHLGIIYYESGQKQKAEEVLERAVTLYPNDPHARRCLGQLLCMCKLYERSRQVLFQSLQLNRKCFKSWNYLGIADLELGYHDRALRCFVKAHVIDRTNPVALNNMGAVYYKLGKYEKAAHYFERALELKESADTRYNLYHTQKRLSLFS